MDAAQFLLEERSTQRNNTTDGYMSRRLHLLRMAKQQAI
jgi:hypothetical protein